MKPMARAALLGGMCIAVSGLAQAAPGRAGVGVLRFGALSPPVSTAPSPGSPPEASPPPPGFNPPATDPQAPGFNPPQQSPNPPNPPGFTTPGAARPSPPGNTLLPPAEVLSPPGNDVPPPQGLPPRN